ncbi:hypothetical protein N8677_00185 [Verrucomicrobia bacterium]|nr:hypothetical protein [Verrucomicrobiota bacterium]
MTRLTNGLNEISDPNQGWILGIPANITDLNGHRWHEGQHLATDGIYREKRTVLTLEPIWCSLVGGTKQARLS